MPWANARSRIFHPFVCRLFQLFQFSSFIIDSGMYKDDFDCSLNTVFIFLHWLDPNNRFNPSAFYAPVTCQDHIDADNNLMHFYTNLRRKLC